MHHAMTTVRPRSTPRLHTVHSEVVTSLVTHHSNWENRGGFQGFKTLADEDIQALSVTNPMIARVRENRGDHRHDSMTNSLDSVTLRNVGYIALSFNSELAGTSRS